MVRQTRTLPPTIPANPPQGSLNGSSKAHDDAILPTYVRPMPKIAEGRGSYVMDVNGNKYLDFTSGIAVVSLGHSDAEITRHIAEQAGTLLHVSNVFENQWAGIFADNLVRLTKAAGTMADAHQVFLSNSGTEANEAALKFGRRFGHTVDPASDKTGLVAFSNAFHGRSFGSLSATPNPKYQSPFGPLVPGFTFGAFNSTTGLDNLITQKTCAVIVEPVQGEGGIHPATPEFLAALRKRCDETNSLLIFDEVQCGLSRTGSFWAHAHPSLKSPSTGALAAEPDILTTAKALGNGFPVGATIVSKRVAECILLAEHGSTYGGNPLASRVANHVITRLSQPELQEAVQDKSGQIIEHLKNLQKQLPNVIEEVRGRGLMIGVQLNADSAPRLPDVLVAARDRGLLILSASSNCLRLLPPLTIDKKDLDAGFRVLEEAIRSVFS